MTTLERRLRAAQALGGFQSIDDIAAAIDRPGMSRKTLRRIFDENDKRTAKDYELEWIAAACEVPVSFLADDDPFAGDAPEVASPGLQVLVRDLTDYLKVQADQNTAKLLGRIGDLEDRIDEVVMPSLEELTRRSKQALVGRGADVDGSTEADTDTREREEATPEAAPARLRGTRRSE